ncbi:MAG TPA: hypothetical protein VGO01_05080 [Bradyrhizobium sp.]|nr:hypothetical protein [Bradyrhizobium sp.]
MADEAFALSPISARAAMPGEADYDAISAAFMETSRGRWFLSEYARRNRNADTSMVLDAVARIEANLAAQKDAAPDHALADALAAIRQTVDEARTAASAALGGAAADESLAPIRGGAQVIRETLLRLREIGADGRIYDLMDSQVSAIEAGCKQIASIDARAALSAAFDLINQRIKGFADDDAPSSVRETPPSPSATMDEPAPAATAEAVSPSEITPEAAAASSEDVAATAEIEIAITDVDIAHDEAVLDLIALEMAAPDFDEPDIADVMAANSVEPDIVVQAAEPPQPEPAPVPQPSLGASLIAYGIVRRPDTSYADPLAPIRRMSQAEKIAFFS